jgi:hypothetical protein
MATVNRKALGWAVGAAGAGAVVIGALAWQLSRPGLRTVEQTAPNLTELLRAHAGRIDFADACSAPIAAGEPKDPKEWAHGIVHLPAPVAALMRLRNLLVRPLGLAAGLDRDIPYTGFPLLAEGESEVVLGADDKHLNFRVGVTTDGGKVVFTTTVTILGPVGRAYWAVVRWFHPPIVRATLRQTRFGRA